MKLLRSGFTLLAALVALTMVSSAQVRIPDFSSTAIQNNSAIPSAGVCYVSYNNPMYPHVLLAFYEDSSNRLAYAYSYTDGETFSGSIEAVDNFGNTIPMTSSSNANLRGCSAANNGATFLLAFADNSGEVTILSGQNALAPLHYTFQVLHQTGYSSAVTTSPGLALDGLGNVVVMYGLSGQPNNNEAFVSYSSNGGSTWSDYNTSATGACNTPTQPGLAYFGGQVFMAQKQNNSSNGIWITTFDTSGHCTNGYQIPGIHTASGLSMTVWNTSSGGPTLLFAGQQNGGNNDLWIYGSTDGVNFTAHDYTALRIGGTPALLPFIDLYGDPGISVSFKANDSRQIMFSDYTSSWLP